MKKLYLIAILFSFSLKCKAQAYYPMLDSVSNNWYLLANYIPVGPESIIVPCTYGWTNNFISYTIFTTGDTVINGATYKILANHDYNLQNACTYGYMREDTAARRIYFMENNFTPEQLLYDFSMQMGDSISLTLFQPGFNTLYQDGYYTLDSIGSKTISAGLRPVYYLNCKTCPFSQTLEWVMGVGNLSHVVYTHSSNSMSWGWFTGICQGFQYNAFDIVVCFEHNQKVYFDSCARNFAYNNFCFAYYDSCNYWNICGGLAENNPIELFSVYPNPASNEINIEIRVSKNTDAQFIIESYDGREVESVYKKLYAGSSKVKTAGFTPGVYFIRCITKNGVLCRKVIINN